MEMELAVNGSDYGLEEKQVSELTNGLSNILKERELLTEAYIDVVSFEITEENIKIFKELRLQIRDNRTKGIEKWHKTNKAYFLTGGRFVDAIKNKEIAENERMESKLLLAEKHFENLEKERVEKLSAERKALIFPYEENDTLKDLGHMEISMFDSLLLGAKTSHENRIAEAKKIEAEHIAKEKAEAEERERIAKENEKLKAEAEAREKQAEAERKEREKLESIRVEKARKEQKEREEKARKEREAYEFKIQKEREEKEKVEAELKAKAEAERKAIEEEEAKKQAELNKGDSDKVKDLIQDLKDLKSKYTFKSKKNKKMYEDVNLLIDKVTTFIS